MVRTAAGAITLSLVLAGRAAAQEAPHPGGPWLHVQQTEDYLVLLSMAEFGMTEHGGATPIVTFLRQSDGLMRTEAVIEADCAQGLRRSTVLIGYEAADPDRPGARIAQGRAVEWSRPGPNDGPMMRFLCEDGAHDATRVRPQASQHVEAWLAAI